LDLLEDKGWLGITDRQAKILIIILMLAVLVYWHTQDPGQVRMMV
jgi:hypothetical protein